MFKSFNIFMNQILYLFSSFFFVQEKDEYGNEVTKIGRPMPMEYFLIEVVISLFIIYLSNISLGSLDSLDSHCFIRRAIRWGQ